jgi:uncharacterized repeat protein (TIGR01451 family)
MSSRLLGSVALACALLVGCASSEKGTTESKPAAPSAAAVRGSDGLYWTERAYPTGDRQTSVVVLESGTPGKVNVGAPYEYVLKVTNISGMSLENVVVVDKPRGNFELRGSQPRSVDGKQLRWELGSLRPRETKLIKIEGNAVGEGQVIHCAEVDWRSLFCSTTQVVKPGLSIKKTATEATLVCDPIVYNVRVANPGTGVARNVVVQDRLPNGVETLDGKNTVRYTLDTLGPGESKTFTWKALAKRPGRFGSVASATADGSLTAKSDDVMTTVTRPALQLTMKGTEKTFLARTMVYDMTLKNTGNGVARDVVLTDNLPSGAKLVGASDGGKAIGTTVRWKLGTMNPGASRSFQVKLSSAQAGTFRSSVSASAYCADAVTAAAETIVSGIPAILLEVVDVQDPVEVGGTTTYMITATNQGSAPGTNIRIAVMLEDTMAYMSAGGATKTSQTGRSIVFERLRSLAPGRKATWQVKVKAVREGDVRIKVAMTSDQLTRPVEETEATNFYK